MTIKLNDLILLQGSKWECDSLQPRATQLPNAHPAADARRQGAERWLSELFGDDHFELTPASADASFRRYFRVTRSGSSWILMDAPPEKEDVRPFIAIAQWLAEVGVNVPEVQQRNLSAGYLLLTDLGTQTYFAALAAGRFEGPPYSDALAALVRMQAHTAPYSAHLPLYDEATLRREMGLFSDWFLGRHLGLILSEEESRALREIHDTLVAAALRQPRVFVHRDYHSRNLMVSDGSHGSNPGILDFQDALLGPITYDLVSLLRDCYVTWPPERVRAWVCEYRAAALDAGLDVGPSEVAFQRWFDLMGVQRHLKAVGIFARLWHRDGKSGYLGDIPRTLDYVIAVSGLHSELAPLHRLLEARVLPAWQATVR